ncbi:tripartite tricarboxylate transporter substrate binding protein [Pseudoroseomonas cervicalis]|uniref:Bug family tripartite tricarboxylate transporter substrate binding protein n=1 Tax=Teichococcus cervicalis TaxID=204525 RepID=UPI0022F14E52|nr:tripartite tricarboxylate transporter substrate binding protein [Pseudoroseomonas cervicalis]WBV41579.1 tripartite tricarboxylate transporter substrate binding protein [Pseudoroseomonas cervicalis]
MNRRGLLSLLGAAALARPALAAAWPERPVTVVVPFPPGGSNDAVTRLFAQSFAPRLGQAFVIDNRAGANGNVGAYQVHRAPADGYTLLASGNGQNAMNHALYRQMPYDSRTGFSHIVRLASLPNAIVVGPGFPARTFNEFIAVAKAKPGSISFASPGAGSSGHLAMAMLQHAAGIELLHVPYRGAAPAITDLLAGQVPMAMINVDIALPHIRAGTLRVLAVTSEQRNPLYPDAPTVAESGFPGFSAVGWLGLSGPAGLPEEIVATLNRNALEIMQEPAIRQRYAASGYIMGGGTPQDYAAFISGEIDKWGEIVRQTGASLD